MSHLTEQQFARFDQQELTAAELLIFNEHVCVCVMCREKVRASLHSRSIEKFSLNYEVNPHLIYEDQVKYFSGNLSEERKEYCLNHLIWCDPCRLDMIDFSAFFSHVNESNEEISSKSKRLRDATMNDDHTAADGFSQYNEQFLKFLNE